MSTEESHATASGWQAWPGSAVAVFDKDDRLLGVASGGPRFGSVGSNDTDTFDLAFSHVVERIPNGAYFVLSVELSD